MLEGRDTPIKTLVTTVSFAVESQKPMREMLPDFLAVRGASMASKRFLLNAKDHLYEQALSMEAPRPTTLAPPTQLGGQHNFPTLRTEFALIYSIFYLSLL